MTDEDLDFELPRARLALLIRWNIGDQDHQTGVDVLLGVEAPKVLGVVGDEGERALADRRLQGPVLHAAEATVVDVRRLVAALDRDIHQ